MPKLAPRRQGPFRISKVVSPVAYQLALPLSWGIHNVFHASLLLPYKETAAHGPNFTRPPPDLIEGEEEYEVEAIINHRHHGRRHQLQYLIKWKGYPSADNTWEAAEDVHADELVKDYHRRHPLKSFKSRTGRGTEKLACALQLFTAAPSPTQKVVSWLLRDITPPTAHGANYPHTPTLSKDGLSASVAHPRSTSIPPSENMPSNMPISTTTPTASTTPPPKLWVNRRVNQLLLTPSKKTLSQLSRTEIIQVENSTPPPSSLLQGKHTLSKEVPTSSTPLPPHDDLRGHPCTPDHSPRPSSRPFAPPSPTSVIWSIKDWLTRSQNSSTVARKKAGNALLNKSDGSKGCKTTSESYTLTSGQPNMPLKQSPHASKSKVFPRPAQFQNPSPSWNHSVLIDQLPRKLYLLRPEHSPNLSLKEKSPYSGRGCPL